MIMDLDFNIILIAIGTLLYIAVSGLFAIRSKLIYNKLKRQVKLRTLVELNIIVSAINVIAPFRAGGLLARTYILKKLHGIPHKINFTASTLEQMIDLAIQAFIAVFCVYLVGIGQEIELVSKIIISLIALLGLILLFFWGGMKGITHKSMLIIESMIPRKIRHIIKKKTNIRKDNFMELINLIQDREDKILFFLGFILATIFIYLIFPIPFYLFVYGFGIHLTITQMFVVFWLPLFLGRVSGIPGGFGVREGSMIYIMSVMGVEAAKATSLTITFRVLTVGAIIISGLILSAKYGMNIFKLRKEEVKKNDDDKKKSK